MENDGSYYEKNTCQTDCEYGKLSRTDFEFIHASPLKKLIALVTANNTITLFTDSYALFPSDFDCPKQCSYWAPKRCDEVPSDCTQKQEKIRDYCPITCSLNGKLLEFHDAWYQISQKLPYTF